MRQIITVVSLLFLGLTSIAQKPELGLPIGHSDAILCVSFSPDGQYVLTGSKDRTAKLWTRKGRVVRTIQQHQRPVEIVKFSPNGKYFVTQDRAMTHLWSIYGELIETFGDPSDNVVHNFFNTLSKIYTTSVQFSPDGEQLLMRPNKKKPAILFSIKQKRKKNIPNTNHCALSFSPDGKYIITQDSMDLHLFNNKGNKIRTLPESIIKNKGKTTHNYAPSVVFIPGKGAIAVGYTTDDLSIYDVLGNEIKYFGNRDSVPEMVGVGFSAFSYPISWSKVTLSNTGKYWAYETTRADSIWDASDYPNLIPFFFQLNTFGGGKTHFSAFSHDDEYFLFRHGFNNSSGKYNTEGVVKDKSGQEVLVIKDLDGWNPYKETLPNLPHLSFPVEFAPDSNHIFVGYKNGAGALMDMQGKVLHVFGRGVLNKVLDLGFMDVDMREYFPGTKVLHFRQELEQDEYGLVLGEVQAQEQVFDFDGGAILGSQKADSRGILIKDNRRTRGTKTFVSTDGQYQLSGVEDPMIGQEDFINPGQSINLSSGLVTIKNKEEEILAELVLTNSVNDVGLSPDNKRLFISPSFQSSPVYVLDLEKVLKKAKEEGINEPIIYAGQNYGERTNYLDFKSAYTCVTDSILNLPRRPYFLDASAISNQSLFSSFRSNAFSLYDHEKKSLLEFKGHRLEVKGAKFFKEDEFILSWSDDYSLKIWKTATGEELATMFFINDQDWVVTTPSGLFDATQGAKELMYYIVDLEVIDIEQLEERFFLKGLLNKLLGYSALGIRTVAGFDHIELYPGVEAEIVRDTLHVRLRNQGGGIGKASIFLNGKERTEEANPLPAVGGPRDSVIAIPLADYFKFVRKHPDSLNTLTIRAYNEEGWLRSRPVNLEFKSAKAAPKGSDEPGDIWQGFSGNPNFYAVVVGTNKYSDKALELSFADQDAAAMAVALKEISHVLYGQGGEVEITCLSTTPIDSSGLATTNIPWRVSTKENIKAVFDDLATKAQPKDVLVVYFSGHGLATGSGEQTQFYYLTKDLTGTGLEDPTIRDQYSISSSELTSWMNEVPAAKGVVILDACNSGAALDAFNNTGSKDLSEGAFEAINRMKYRTGTFLIAGSAPDKLSYESKQYGQGLLTYAILKGMLEAFISKKEGKFVDVTSLFEYACNTVPTLAEAVEGVQRPMMGTPKGAGSFDIGMITDAVNIPIRDQYKIITRSVFQDSSSYQDKLDLIQILEARLRGESKKGLNADFVFMDANSYENAYSVGGIYTQKSGKIHLKAFLFQNKTMVKALDIPPSSNVNTLARVILLEIKDYFKSLKAGN